MFADGRFPKFCGSNFSGSQILLYIAIASLRYSKNLQFNFPGSMQSTKNAKIMRLENYHYTLFLVCVYVILP